MVNTIESVPGHLPDSIPVTVYVVVTEGLKTISVVSKLGVAPVDGDH